MNQQLAINLPINIQATFANFCWHNNMLVKQQLEATLLLTKPQHTDAASSAVDGLSHAHMLDIKERFIYLFGQAGCGKTHLLQACCQAVLAEQTAVYLPMRTLIHWSCEVLEDLEEQALICLDDIDAVAGLPAWEEALFHLYNRVRANDHTVLIMSSQSTPVLTNIKLADLCSRLYWGWVLELHELNDDQKIRVLQAQAEKRGFTLTDAVGHYLINHYARNMPGLQHILDRLDKASLIAQRKITIPFVKETLGAVTLAEQDAAKIEKF